MIKLVNVSHAYGHGAARMETLREISIEIGNEFLAIVGPSGSGKSTLLKILAGFERPLSGRILWGGRHRAAMVFQDYSLLPWLSVRENIELYPRLRGASSEERTAISSDLMNQLGLSTYADLLPYQLSGGMQQRVAIGRAFAQTPDLLLMDEPFGALDAMTRVDAQSTLLRIYGERKCTVVFVTHDVEEALMLGDRIVVLTARPARIADVLDVPFPRPRPSDLQWKSDFVTLRREIVSRLREYAATGSDTIPK